MMKINVRNCLFACILSVVSCKPRSYNSGVESNAQPRPSSSSAFQNGAACGTVQARPDHGLDEKPIQITVGAETRFVNVTGSAFQKLVKFLNSGEKIICLSADWAKVQTPTIDSFQLVSVPDFHGPEGSKSAFQNGAACGTVQARPDHGLDEKPIQITVGAETRFVNVTGSAFQKLVKFLNSGEKIICLSADWAKVQTPTIDSFQLVSVPDFHGPEGR